MKITFSHRTDRLQPASLHCLSFVLLPALISCQQLLSPSTSAFLFSVFWVLITPLNFHSFKSNSFKFFSSLILLYGIPNLSHILFTFLELPRCCFLLFDYEIQNYFFSRSLIILKMSPFH